MNAGNSRRCILNAEKDPECRPGECRRCGWNEPEIRRRKLAVETDGLETLGNGLRGLVIPRKNPETGLLRDAAQTEEEE